MKRNLHAGRQLSSGLSLNILTDDELDEIHYGTLEVLNETGVFIEDKNAIVKIPPYMVEDAIRSAPPKVVLYGRDPKHDIVLENTRVYFTNFSEGVMVNDPYTGENRSPVKKDLIDSAKVIDALPEIDFCEKALGAHDVNQDTVPRKSTGRP